MILLIRRNRGKGRIILNCWPRTLCKLSCLVAFITWVELANYAEDTNGVHLIDLPTTLRLAHARNLDIQIARSRLKEAQAVQESAREQFFPWLSPGVSYRRHQGQIQDVGGEILDVNKQSYGVGASLAAQVELGDAIYKSLAAKQLVTAADHDLESQRQESTLAAAQGYYDLTRAKALADVVREAVNISSDYQSQLHKAVAAGIAFKGDELRVQTQTERYQIALRQALEQQRVAAARLAQLLHLVSSIELVPRESDLVPLTLLEANAALDSLVQQALNFRPELKRSEALVSAAREGKHGATYGPLIPSAGAEVFGGGLGGGKNDSLGNFGPTQDYFVGLAWRIGPGGLFDFGRIHAGQARLQTAELHSEKLRDEITRQVVESHTRVQSLFDQLGTGKQNLATASETLRLTRERKQFGVGIVLEDIQAQQELTRAKSDYLTTVAEYNKAQYALSWAVGTSLDR
jgi:outer membrane protein TolC